MTHDTSYKMGMLNHSVGAAVSTDHRGDWCAKQYVEWVTTIIILWPRHFEASAKRGGTKSDTVGRKYTDIPCFNRRCSHASAPHVNHLLYGVAPNGIRRCFVHQKGMMPFFWTKQCKGVQ
jgi:hypothetical protein